MSEISDAKNLVGLFENYIKPLILKKDHRSDSEKFLEILEDIGKRKSPLHIAEKLCTVLEERFIQIHNRMRDNDEDYYELLNQIVQTIENNFEETISVWKDRLIYFRNVKEVWVACEPILDLIDTEEGSFDLLERQLKHVEKITYFLTDRRYFDDLVAILKSRNFASSKIAKLQCMIIPERLRQPIVIYITNNHFHGMAGKYHPDIIKDKANQYVFRKNKELPTNWLYYLSKDKIQNHYANLKNSFKNN